MDELTQLVCKVLRVKAGVPGPEDNLRKIGEWDSLNHMELITAIEDRWQITLTSEEIIGMQSLQDIRFALGRHGVEGYK